MLTLSMKDLYISDLASFEEGKLFDSYFLVLARQQRTTQTNKPYLNIVFCDKTGQLEGRVWDVNDHRVTKDFERGDVVKVRGCVSRYNDKLQMKVEQLRTAQAGEIEKADLMPATSYDVQPGRSACRDALPARPRTAPPAHRSAGPRPGERS